MNDLQLINCQYYKKALSVMQHSEGEPYNVLLINEELQNKNRRNIANYFYYSIGNVIFKLRKDEVP